MLPFDPCANVVTVSIHGWIIHVGIYPMIGNFASRIRAR